MMFTSCNNLIVSEDASPSFSACSSYRCLRLLLYEWALRDVDLNKAYKMFDMAQTRKVLHVCGANKISLLRMRLLVVTIVP